MKDLSNALRRIGNEARRLVTGRLPATIGKMAEDHFRQSFRDEGFTDASLQKWPDVKRRTHPRKGATRRERTAPILTQSGELGDSIRWDQDYDKQVVIKSDIEYAQIHNEGGMAGRGRKVRIPKRQFMGPSKKLEQKIQKEIIREVDLLFKFK